MILRKVRTGRVAAARFLSRPSSRRFFGVSFALALALLLTAPGAFAQGTGAAVDYGALATGAKTEIVGAITTSAPVVFGIMALIVAVGLTMNWVRRAAH